MTSYHILILFTDGTDIGHIYTHGAKACGDLLPILTQALGADGVCRDTGIPFLRPVERPW